MSKTVDNTGRRSRGKSVTQQWIKCDKCSTIVWNNIITKQINQHKCGEDYQLCGIINNKDNINNISRHGIINIGREGFIMAGFRAISKVLVQVKEGQPIVLTCCPEPNPMISICLNKDDIHDEDVTGKEVLVSVKSFDSDVTFAETVSVSVDDDVDPEMFLNYIRFHFDDRIIHPKHVLKVYLYGKYLKIKINRINSSDSDLWYLTTRKTIWNLPSKDTDDKSAKAVADPGGVGPILERINSLIDLVLCPQSVSISKYMKTLLIYGHSGTGKTCICEHLVDKLNIASFSINTSEIYSKYYGETEAKIKQIFEEAYKKHPSIIVIEDLHILCPKRSGIGSEQEKRVSSTVATLLDELHNKDASVFILMTTNKLESIDPNLRRCGRIDNEIEIPIPDKTSRLDVLYKMLKNVSHNLKNEDLQAIAASANGFVGADLKNLCTQASMHMLKRNSDKISFEDFKYAIEQVKPSAMREILIDIPDIRWDDIGGQENLKLKLKQMIEWPLKHAESFTRLGIKPPSGVLMYGPPGCSKTMVAKALANETKLNFLSIKGPELFSKWVGESERAVRDLFRKARQVAPSIIFFDEIDALGGERSNQNSGSNVQERVLAQLLTEMDGISSLGNVTIIAATNRPDKMDPALLRPGRLDHIVYISLPDIETRRAIFNIKFSKMPISPEVDVEDLVNKTVNYSGAEIQAVCQEAGMKALEENINSSCIFKRHFDFSLSSIQPRTPAKLLEIYNNFERTIK